MTIPTVIDKPCLKSRFLCLKRNLKINLDSIRRDGFSNIHICNFKSGVSSICRFTVRFHLLYRNLFGDSLVCFFRPPP